MKTKEQIHPNLFAMNSEDINLAALEVLDNMLERCTLHLVCELTGISRTTLYKWLDDDVAVESMSARDSAWFILQCETNPKLVMLLERGPASHPKLAKRLTDGVTP